MRPTSLSTTPRRRRAFTGATALAALAALALGGCVDEREPFTLSATTNTTNDQGWIGRQVAINRQLLAEELDSNHDGRVDFWRYYDRGRLVAEERDLRGDGRIHYVSLWEPTTGRLWSAGRDSDGRGVFDVQVETCGGAASGQYRWLISEDRNRDGFVDLTLEVEGPANLFGGVVGDLAVAPSVWEAVPVEYWREIRRDDVYTGTLGLGVRYAGGVVTHREIMAENDARRWERVAEGDATPWTPSPAFPAGPVGTDPYGDIGYDDTGYTGYTGYDAGGAVPLPLPIDGGGLYDAHGGGAMPVVSGGDDLYGAHLGAGAEVPSMAAERAVRRRFPGGAPEGESVAGAFPRNMRVRMPGQ